jgi:hypothetical protein
MIPRVVVAALVVCLSPAWLHAQTAKFTVTAAPAEVHKAPSVGSPVIGKAPRGTVMEVRRELGSWVAIPWPAAENALAYLHVNTGTIVRDAGSDVSRDVESVAARIARASTPATTAPTASASSEAQRSAQVPQRPLAPATVPTYVAPPAHTLGLGASVGGSTMAVGLSARHWWRNRFGVQVAVSHSNLTSTLVPEHLSSVQIEPGVLYALRDRVSDYVWLRPYVGSSLTFHRQSFQVPSAVDAISESHVGLQTFGGAEFSFATLPRFAVSADVGYRWAQQPTLPGFDLDGPVFSVSGHWYVR